MSENINYAAMPDQTGYIADLDEVEGFDLGTCRSHPIMFTNEYSTFLITGDPGDYFDWHTHVADMDQVIVCLDGKARYRLKQEDGSEQHLDLEPYEMLYLPGGATHRVEVIGDEHHKELVVMKDMFIPRLEMYDADFDYYDKEDWPIALWVDRTRDEVVQINEDAVRAPDPEE